jgi:NAD(P)-dependent dehydrogenase (short-subunit alcohol dehydrogenase family)
MKIPSFDLTGKTAIITGATKGLGYGMAQTLASAGADLVVVSRTEADCQAVAAEIRGMGRRAHAVPTDVTRPDQIQNLLNTAVAKFGRIDILVNNAGTAITKKAIKLTEEDWDRIMDVNLKGPFLLTQAVGRQMISQNSGKVINIASMFGLVGDINVLPYLCSKGGIIQMTRGLALEWARYNIQVNAVCPGYVKTALNTKVLETEKVFQYITEKTPMRRYGEIWEIAGIVQFLASSASDFITGAVIPVDGGWTAQ